MRRLFSISLVLFFGLWPLTGALEGSDDARLPACCRRHGAHHCAMSMEMAAMMAPSAAPTLSAPMRCPLFPGFMAGPSAPAYALAASVTGLPVLVVRAHGLAACGADVRIGLIGVHAGRGPPASTLN